MQDNISVDPKTYLLYLIRKYKIRYFENFLSLGQNQGPQEFLVELLSCLSTRYAINILPIFLPSYSHLINSGNYFKFWDFLKLKQQKFTFLRLDGIVIDSFFSNKKEFKIHFKKINNLIQRSDNLIFQSEFSQKAFTNISHLKKNSCVIKNGCSQINLFESDYKYLENLRRNLPLKYFVVAGRNIKRKRIDQVINIFNKYNLGNLVVLSNFEKEKQFKNSRIYYMGLQEKNIARFIIKKAQAIIHLDSYDWCPNIVSQAVFDRVPVICSNYGGTQEIVKNSGLIINEFKKDLEVNLENIKFAQNKKIEFELVVDSLKKIKNNTDLEVRNDISIDFCTSKYYEFIFKGRP